MTIREQIAEYNPEAVLFDDLDDAIIGVGQQWGSTTVAIYSREKCIDIFRNQFMENDRELLGRELTDEELENAETSAIEWFDYNVGCAYVGENTPIFLEKIDED